MCVRGPQESGREVGAPHLGQRHRRGDALQDLLDRSPAEVDQEVLLAEGVCPVCTLASAALGRAGLPGALAAPGRHVEEEQQGRRASGPAPGAPRGQLQALRTDHPAGRNADDLQLPLPGLADVSPHRREGVLPAQLCVRRFGPPGHRTPALRGDGDAAAAAQRALRICPLLLLPGARPAPHFRAPRQPGHGRRQGRPEDSGLCGLPLRARAHWLSAMLRHFPRTPSVDCCS
mmetsp:Transcript_21541/g.64701  ORF Transcript_21541/g.64701 Transcript_21541/m.64701 type:complete len:232 (-) Transcript_21541:123-818(-)